jgi:hypothetical protein
MFVVPFLTWALWGGDMPLVPALKETTVSVFSSQPEPTDRLGFIESWIRTETPKMMFFVETTREAVVNHRLRIEQLEEQIIKLEEEVKNGASAERLDEVAKKVESVADNPSGSSRTELWSGIGALVLGSGGLVTLIVRYMRNHLSQVLLEALAAPPPPILTTMPDNPTMIKLLPILAGRSE